MNHMWKKIAIIWIVLGLLFGGFFIFYKSTHSYIATILIDPGHGGYDPGAIGSDQETYEKEITMEIAYKIGQQITKLDPTIKVEFTRLNDEVSWPSNETDDLYSRIQIADAIHADYFLSIHLNASENPNGYGYEGFCKASDFFSQEVYLSIKDRLERLPYSQDRGLYTNTPLMVVDQQAIPSLLFEVGFISNPSELEAMKNPLLQNQIAHAIARSYVDKIHEEKAIDEQEE